MEAEFDWLPPGGRAQVDAENRVVTVAAPRADLAFGEIPDDWTVQISGLPARDLSITAEKVGRSVTLTLNHQGTSTIGIGATFRTVHARSRSTSQLMRLVINRNGTKLALWPGRYQVDGDHKEFSLDLTNAPGGLVRLTGSAKARSVRGSDVNLRIEAPLSTELDLNELSGEVTVPDVTQTPITAPNLHLMVQGTVTSSAVTVRELHVSGAIFASTLRLGGLQVEGEITDTEIFASALVSLRGTVTGCTFDLEGSLHVGTLREAGPNEWQRWRGAVPAMSDTTVTARGSELLLGPIENVVVSASGDVWINGQASSDGSQQLVVDGTLRVKNSLVGLTVECDSLEVEEHVQDSTISANTVLCNQVLRSEVHTKNLQVGEEVDEASTIALTGEATFKGNVAGRINWSPDSSSQIEAQAHIEHLVAKTDDSSGANLTTNSIGRLNLTGRLEFGCGSDARIASLQLSKGSTLILRSEHATEIMEAVAAAQGANLGFDSRAAKAALLLTLGQDSTLTIATNGAVIFRGEDEHSREARLQLAGMGSFEFTCEVGVVNALSICPDWFPSNDERAEQIPEIHSPRSGAILSLAGDARLGILSGRVAGQDPTSWKERKTRRPAARIHAIAEQAEALGLLTGIDPTTLPYAHLDNLEGLHVFEPDGRALIGHAAIHIEDSFVARSRAQQMHRISELVSRRAITGAARSAARWAAARTQHATVERWSLENLLRWIHRALGYSQRPIPPLTTWLILSAVWALVVGSWPHVESITKFFDNLFSVLFVPGSLFRLPQEDGSHLLFESLRLHTIVFLSTGIPLAFFIVALRNFLFSPHEAK